MVTQQHFRKQEFGITHSSVKEGNSTLSLIRELLVNSMVSCFVKGQCSGNCIVNVLMSKTLKLCGVKCDLNFVLHCFCLPSHSVFEAFGQRDRLQDGRQKAKLIQFT